MELETLPFLVQFRLLYCIFILLSRSMANNSKRMSVVGDSDLLQYDALGKTVQID